MNNRVKIELEEEKVIGRATRWLPLFIIVLLVILVIVYLQSTRVTVPEQSSADELLPDSKVLGDHIQQSAEDILESFPAMKMTVSSLSETEENELTGLKMPAPKSAVPVMTDDSLTRILEKEKSETHRAIELVSPDAYINTESVTVKDLVGKKVILVDFWSSSSINSQRHIDNIKRWHAKYKDLGLEIISVHTPEFSFEKDITVVESAVKRLGIEYPVVVDNNFYSWRAYDNRFWPTAYLIDIDGFIVLQKSGDSNCDIVEDKIRELLIERKEALGEEGKDLKIPSDNLEYDFPPYSNIKTPTIYLGFAKNRGDLGNDQGFMANLPVKYTLPEMMVPNAIYLEGEWLNKDDHMVLKSDSGKIVLEYTAKDVNMVAGGDSQIQIRLDDEEVAGLQSADPRLYNIIKGEDYGKHKLELTINNKGFKLYSFSFG